MKAGSMRRPSMAERLGRGGTKQPGNSAYEHVGTRQGAQRGRNAA